MSAKTSKAWLGPLLIALAALLWATDAPFRYPAIQAIHPIWVVFFEHLIGVTVLSLWALLARKREILAVRPFELLGLILIGAGGSALATVLFSASFRYVNPSVSILLQKLQPILVVLLAYGFLKERPKTGFYRWAALALAAAGVLSFPDMDFSALRGGLDLRSRGVLSALAAATIWALSTVVGKALLGRLQAGVVIFWRYVWGWITLALLLGLARIPLPVESFHVAIRFQNFQFFQALAYIALIPGLLAMVLYYSGLSRTQASTATFTELLYPVSAIALNTLLLQHPLSTVQACASAVLLFAVTRISLLKK